MERIWLREYPPSVPADVDVSAFASVNALLVQSCQQFADQPAYSNLGVTLRYRDIDRLTRDFAAYLQQGLGLQKGARVAIMLPNILQYPIALFGILRAGLIVVNVNPLYTPRELAHQLTDAGATAVVILRNFAHTLHAIIDQTTVKTVILTELGDLFPWPQRVAVNLAARWVGRHAPTAHFTEMVPFRTVLRAGSTHPLQEVPLDHDDIAFLQYTGGTTGVAKGAMLTHGNIVANVQQASAWLSPFSKPAEETVITALPLYHIFSLTANCLTFMKVGGHNILITNPRDLRGFVRILRKTRFTVISGVNTLFNALLNTPGFDQLDFSALKISLGGGTAVQRAVAERWQQITGVPVLEAYGLTETSPAVCINPLTITTHDGSIGLPIPSTEISIRDENDQALGIGEAGELCVRGPQVMRGYWQRPEETAQVLGADGFLRTGDIAVIDERGYLRIVDRKKDVILVSGFNVYPNEIEEVVMAHPDVLEAAAIGVSDPKSGEAVRLFVVRKTHTLTAETVIAHCRTHLTGYKIPHTIVFREHLPKSNVGKILRRALRDET